MKLPFSLIWRLATTETHSAVCFLIYLRLVVVGIAITVLLVWHFFYQPYDRWAATLLVFVGVLLWSFWVQWKDSLQTNGNPELREILIDLVWIFLIVLFAGRAANPFIYYFLVVVALAATLLSHLRAWFVCGLSIALYSVLLLIDVQAHFAHLQMDYRLHLIGMWLNYLISTFVTCYFVTHLMTVLRHQHHQMLDFREKNLKNEQLIGLATVAASAVHNLATPLSTLRVLIDDLAIDKKQNDGICDDLELMRKQIHRCHRTINELALLAQKSDEKLPLNVIEMIDSLREHYALHFPDREPLITHELSGDIFVHCSSLFQYATINLINNAIESSSDQAEIHFSVAESELKIEIKNSCSEDEQVFFARWGKPTKSSKASGLGIGSMLANSTIERQGGTVSLETNRISGMSAQTEITVTVNFPIGQPEIVLQ